MTRGGTLLLLAAALLLVACGKDYEVVKGECALIPSDAKYELTAAAEDQVPTGQQRTVELRRLEAQARQGEGPGALVPKGTAVKVAEKQNSDIPDWTQVTLQEGDSKGQSGLVRRVCIGEGG